MDDTLEVWTVQYDGGARAGKLDIGTRRRFISGDNEDGEWAIFIGIKDPLIQDRDSLKALAALAGVDPKHSGEHVKVSHDFHVPMQWVHAAFTHQINTEERDTKDDPF